MTYRQYDQLLPVRESLHSGASHVQHPNNNGKLGIQMLWENVGLRDVRAKSGFVFRIALERDFTTTAYRYAYVACDCRLLLHR